MSENQQISSFQQNDDAGSAADHEQQIRERAFFLWQEAGSPQGREEEFWHQARAHSDTKQEVEQHNPNASPAAASGQAKE
jgi:hypothetical protein